MGLRPVTSCVAILRLGLSSPVAAKDEFWFFIYGAGSKPERSMYFANINTIRNVYTPETQAALDIGNPKSNSVALVQQLSGNEFMAITAVEVFEYENEKGLAWIQLDMNVNCKSRDFVIKKTERGYNIQEGWLDGVRKESENSDTWEKST